MLLSVPLLLLPLPVSTPRTLSVRPGSTAEVTLRYAMPDVLLNRNAPNSLSLATPWQKAQATFSGKPRSEAQWADYYATVEPILFKVIVPATIRNGTYPASLNAQLFVCDQREKVCRMRKVSLPLNIKVSSGAPRPSPLTLDLRF